MIVLCMLTSVAVIKPLDVNAENDTPPTYSMNNWLSFFDDDICLTQINMPGTHDTATYNIEWYAVDGGQTQYKDIYDQLDLGVRVMDIRLFADDDDISWKDMELVHASFSCHKDSTCDYKLLKISDVLDDAMRFLQRHSTETVIMNIQADANKPDTRAVIKKMAERLRADREWNEKDYYNVCRFYKYGDAVPTLGEARGKIIMATNVVYVNGEEKSMYTKFEDHYNVSAGDKIDWLKKTIEYYTPLQDYTKINHFIETPEVQACKTEDGYIEP